MELSEAFALAWDCHKGQTDKSGVPYIGHIIGVTAKVPEGCKLVAVFHDSVEDTDMTFEKLAYYLCEDDVEAVRLLTFDPKKMTRTEYLIRIRDAKGVPGMKARRVKNADLDHNMDPARRLPGEKGEAKYQEYKKEKDIINGTAL